jgi:hypothetical protein
MTCGLEFIRPTCKHLRALCTPSCLAVVSLSWYVDKNANEFTYTGMQRRDQHASVPVYELTIYEQLSQLQTCLSGCTKLTRYRLQPRFWPRQHAIFTCLYCSQPSVRL